MSLKLVGDNFDYSDCIAYNFEFGIPNFRKFFSYIFLIYRIMICLWLIPIIYLLKLKLEKISKFCIITHKQEYKEIKKYIFILKSTYLGLMGVKECGLGDLIRCFFGIFCFVSVEIKGRSCCSNDHVTIQIIIHVIKVDVNGHLNGHIT